jgi:hypothetical protein
VGLISLDDFLDRLAKSPLLFQPGEAWEYSCKCFFSKLLMYVNIDVWYLVDIRYH